MTIQEPKPTGVVGALLALSDLREAMKTIQIPSSMYMPGKRPTAADACEKVLEMMEWNLKQLGTFLNEIRG